MCVASAALAVCSSPLVGLSRFLPLRLRCRSVGASDLAGVRFGDCVATSSGVPQATIRPPPSPPSGPMSMIQSAVFDDVEIVLDDEHRVAGVDEVVQHFEQQLDIGEVEAGRRLVEQVQRAAGAIFSPARGPA